jgi:hypothetical protein
MEVTFGHDAFFHVDEDGSRFWWVPGSGGQRWKMISLFDTTLDVKNTEYILRAAKLAGVGRPQGVSLRPLNGPLITIHLAIT